MEKSILIQGAMKIETQTLIKQLNNCEKLVINGYEYYLGSIHSHNVIISITKVGSIHTAVSTILGIHQFHPQCIINQGVAGGHSRDVHKGDIVLGQYAVDMNSYITQELEEHHGMHPESWKLISFKEGNDVEKEKIEANPILLRNFEIFIKNQFENRVHIGTIVSGDSWNREIDRIKWFIQQVNSKCEDMESYAAYKVCSENQVPILGIRIISNSEINKESYDTEMALKLQNILIKSIEKNIIL